VSRRRRSTLAALLGSLTLQLACQVTWREPEVKPLNPVAIFPAVLERTCTQLADALQLLGGTLDTETIVQESCLFETAAITLTNTGDPVNRLDEVAYLGNQNSFSRGRYYVTASARPTTVEGNTRVRLTTRIEGYDGDFRLLRSRGLIERTIIEQLGELLGVRPIEE